MPLKGPAGQPGSPSLIYSLHARIYTKQTSHTWTGKQMGIRLHVKSDSQRRKWNMGLEESLSQLVQPLRAECAWIWIGCKQRLGLWCLPWSYSALPVVYFIIKLAWVIICTERLRICFQIKLNEANPILTLTPRIRHYFSHASLQ